MAFHDIYPVAPVHLLVIPKKHMASLNEMDPQDSEVAKHLFAAIQHVARSKGIDQTGYRVTTNVGHDGGQVVFHLHFHVMGGHPLGRMA